ncbi:MAG: amidohydrolase family protein, partial [Candidatus Odinarchaeota archaeon]
EKDNHIICNLWANALDLALNVNNKFQVSLSLNFPNYANISDIPEIATWLVSKDARESFMKGMNNNFLKNNPLAHNSKELNFFEFIYLTRASPAKSLGLANIKGNLGLGADADFNILNINIDDIDISQNYEELKKALSNIEYVIKAGKIAKRQNEFDFDINGSIFWSSGKIEEKEKKFVMTTKKDFFQKYSSLFYDSFKDSIDKNLIRRV